MGIYVLIIFLPLTALFVGPQRKECSGQGEQAPLSPVRTRTGEESRAHRQVEGAGQRTPCQVEGPNSAACFRHGLPSGSPQGQGSEHDRGQRQGNRPLE